MKKLYIVLLLCIVVAATGAEETKEEPLPIGFIFNVSNILDAPQSYQGGVGMKLLTEKVNMRIMADLYYSQESSTSSFSIGFAVEKHLYKSFISPYFGFSAGAAYILLEDKINDDNWTKETIIPLEGGPIFGVEVFFTEYLSFFVEYIANFSYRLDTTTVATAGNESASDDSYFTFDTKMGNNAMLGLTIYLDDQVVMPKRK